MVDENIRKLASAFSDGDLTEEEKEFLMNCDDEILQKFLECYNDCQQIGSAIRSEVGIAVHEQVMLQLQSDSLLQEDASSLLSEGVDLCSDDEPL